jgi:transposase
MPWVSGKHRLTEAYTWFLASWAKRLSWKEVAEAFRTTWDHVFCSVERAVTWGREHQDLSGVKAIGVDEIAWQRGHRYLTLVYQIDEHCKRLLWVGEKRTVKTLLRFFRWFGKERSQTLKYVCSDGQTGHQIGRASQVQSEIDQELPSEGRVSVILAIHLAVLGGSVSGYMVHQDHALKD